MSSSEVRTKASAGIGKALGELALRQSNGWGGVTNDAYEALANARKAEKGRLPCWSSVSDSLNCDARLCCWVDTPTRP